MTDNHRRHERVPANAPVEISKGTEAVSGNLKDISFGGAAIEFAPDLGKSSLALSIGDDISLNAGQTDPVTGKIVRQEDTGIAMQFDRETTLPED